MTPSLRCPDCRSSVIRQRHLHTGAIMGKCATCQRYGHIAEFERKETAVGKAGKGTALRVEGRIKTHEVEGKQYRWELKGEVLEVLEYEPRHVRVHDLVHVRQPDGTWDFRKSAYRKLRLSEADAVAKLEAAGLAVQFRDQMNGLVTLIAGKG